jgi:hypothetical protein
VYAPAHGAGIGPFPEEITVPTSLKTDGFLRLGTGGRTSRFSGVGPPDREQNFRESF